LWDAPGMTGPTGAEGTPWEPLYRTERLRYDPEKWPFSRMIRDACELPAGVPLGKLHTVDRPRGWNPWCAPLRLGYVVAGKGDLLGKTTKNKMKQAWRQSQFYADLMALFRDFVREVVLPHLGVDSALVQLVPTVRIVLPGEFAFTQRHRDGDYGHKDTELNFWMPLTPVAGANSLWIESTPGVRDFTDFRGDDGHVFRFWGNQCEHYTVPNATENTRVSFDFRVIPEPLFESGVSPERTLRHGGELRVGSYYMMVRREATDRDGGDPELVPDPAEAVPADWQQLLPESTENRAPDGEQELLAGGAPGTECEVPEASGDPAPGTEQAVPEAGGDPAPGTEQAVPGQVVPGASGDVVPDAGQVVPGASGDVVPDAGQGVPGRRASGGQQALGETSTARSDGEDQGGETMVGMGEVQSLVRAS